MSLNIFHGLLLGLMWVGVNHNGLALAQTPDRPTPPPDSPSWETVTSPAGRYSVQMPGQPASSVLPLTVDGTPLNWQIQHYEQPTTPGERPEDYLVAYADLPPSFTANRTPDAILDATAAAMNNHPRLQGLFRQQRPLTFNGYPSRVLFGERNGNTIAANLTLVGDRLYLGLVSSDEREDFEDFFSSLEFTTATAPPTRQEPVRSSTEIGRPEATPVVPQRETIPAAEPSTRPVPVRALW